MRNLKDKLFLTLGQKIHKKFFLLVTTKALLERLEELDKKCEHCVKDCVEG